MVDPDGVRVRVRGLAIRDGSTTFLGGPDGIDLDLEPGSRTLLVGPSGAGKSTLLRALAGLTEDLDGANSGEVALDDEPAHAGIAGLLLQDPQETVVAASAGRDTAFGPENRALGRAEIWQRVAEAHAAADVRVGLGRDTATLSGGELQRLGLAGILALRPGLMLLDEPTSMLDAATARAVRDAILAAVGRRTLVVVDHDLEAWADVVDRVLVLAHDGTLVLDGTPDRVFGAGRETLHRLGIRVPGSLAPEPVTFADLEPLLALTAGSTAISARDVGLVVRNRGIRPGPPVPVLHGIDVDLRAGSFTALAGGSGAGKSSLLTLVAGLRRPTTGTVLAGPELARGLRRAEPGRWRSRDLAARFGWMPQHPDRGFVRSTVLEEVRATPAVLGHGGGGERRADQLLEILGLDHRAGLDPRLLSGGEQRRLGAACALAAAPSVLFADEPTVGQDGLTWSVVTGLLRSAARSGTTVAVASHDVDLLALADATVHLRSGRRVSEQEVVA